MTDNSAPVVFDAKNRNSLSLAPSILDILKIDNQENYFLGNSLFCDEVSEFQYISTTGHRIFSTKSGNVQKVKLDSSLKEKLVKFFKVFGWKNSCCDWIYSEFKSSFISDSSSVSLRSGIEFAYITSSMSWESLVEASSIFLVPASSLIFLRSSS